MYSYIIDFMTNLVNILIPLIFLRIVADIFRDFFFKGA